MAYERVKRTYIYVYIYIYIYIQRVFFYLYMEVARRRGRRRKKLLNDLKDRRGYSHLKREAVDLTMWRNRFGGGVGHDVRQNTQ